MGLLRDLIIFYNTGYVLLALLNSDNFAASTALVESCSLLNAIPII